MIQTLTVLVVVVLLSARPTSGQTIRGQVRDSISGAPVDRGFVVLLDDAGAEVTRILTSVQGQFTISAPGPGTYRLRSERIGFRVWESNQVRLNPGQVYELDPLISQIPRRLATIDVAGETECEERKGPDTGLLWDEARKALVAASWSAEQELYVHRLHRVERILDDSRDPVREDITVRIASSQLPFVSLDPVRLANEGYVVRETSADTSGWDWWGPDANVFLHPSFHETHCFWAQNGEGEQEGLVGLVFEPVPGREIPDVAGTLWLDGESWELRYIEFEYRTIPLGVTARDLGGRAEFVAMPSGGWILDRWYIRIPRVRQAGRRVRIVGYVDAGGTVIDSYQQDGQRVYESPDVVVVTGTVFDSVAGQYLAGERVMVHGTDYVVETDEGGSFEMRTLLEGPYSVTSRRMEWMGYQPGRRELEFRPGDSVHVDLTVPSANAVHAYLCPRSPPGENRVVHGRFRTPSGGVVADARVTAEWEPGIRRRDETDRYGQYVLCDLPEGQPLMITVEHELLGFDPVQIEFVGRDVIVGPSGDGESFYVPDRIVRLVLESRPPAR